MNENESNNSESNDDLARLIRFAGAREDVSDERMAVAHARVSNHWQSVLADNRTDMRRSRFRQFASAAAIVAAVGVGYFAMDPGSELNGESLIAVERVSGTVHINGVLANQNALFDSGSRIETGGDGLVALTMPDGQSLRLDTSSELVVLASSQVELQGGAVYIDSEAGVDQAQITVLTHLGSVTDIGTQFQVRVIDSFLQVGVREGLIEVTRDNQDLVHMDAGQWLEFPEAGPASGRRIAGNDPLWAWTTLISPPFEIEGASLQRYLSWYSRESGLSIEWTSASEQAQAASIVLSASIDGMTLDEGLEFVRRIAPFESRIEDTRFVVSVP